MHRARPDKDAGVIADIHRWLLESGSVAHAQAYADREAVTGLAALEGPWRAPRTRRRRMS